MGTDASFEREKSIMFGATRLFPLVYTYDKNSEAAFDNGYPRFFMDPVFHAAPQLYCNACKSHVSGCFHFVAFWDETFEWCLKNNHPFGLIILQQRTYFRRTYNTDSFKFRAFEDIKNFLKQLGKCITLTGKKDGLAFRTFLKAQADNLKRLFLGETTQNNNNDETSTTDTFDSRDRFCELQDYVKNVSTIIENSDPDNIIDDVLHDSLFDPMTICPSFKGRFELLFGNMGSDCDFNTSLYDYIVVAYNHCYDMCDFINNVGTKGEGAAKTTFSCGLTPEDFPKGDYSNPVDRKTMKRRGKKKNEEKSGETIYEMATNLPSVYDMGEWEDFDHHERVPDDFHEKSLGHDVFETERWNMCRRLFKKTIGSDFFILRKCSSTKATDYDRKMSCRSTVPKVGNMYGSYAPTTSNWLIKSNAIIPSTVEFDNLASELVVDPYAIWLKHRLYKYPNIKIKNDTLDPKNQKTFINYLKAVDQNYVNKHEENLERRKRLKKEENESKKRKREETKKSRSQKRSKK
jgi:hypothetical protein